LRQPKVNYFKVPLADGLKSTLIVMRELERIALSEDTFLRWIERHFKKDCGGCQLRKVWQFMQDNFDYLDDEYDEVVISPAILISKRKGDCDDFALFAHTILTALMIPCKYILLGAENNKPSHIAVYALGTVVDGTNNRFNVIADKYKYYSFA